MFPKKTKYRKTQKGSLRGMAKRGCFVGFGSMGIQALSRGYISSKQLEAARVTISRALNREGRALFRVFPQKPLTSQPIQTRMGKGKGSVDCWVACIKPGMILIEIVGNNNKEKVREALRKASCKLSLKTRCVEPIEVF